MSRLPVIEMFHSIQGEGTRVGEPATFIRFAGCNLRCTWCDTPYSWSAEGVRAAEKVEVKAIASRVRERAVVLTGGEPLLHLKHFPQLLTALRAAGVGHITVETNGTIAPESVWGDVDLWSVSPKLPGSGERPDVETVRTFVEAVPGRLQLKFVLADLARDYDAMWHLLDQVDPQHAASVIVQPDGLREDYDLALRELSEHVTADTEQNGSGPRRALVRVVPQTHRIAWGAAARGV
jgi:7-carboxy-7-deazaguanine synthase